MPSPRGTAKATTDCNECLHSATCWPHMPSPRGTAKATTDCNECIHSATCWPHMPSPRVTTKATTDCHDWTLHTFVDGYQHFRGAQFPFWRQRDTLYFRRYHIIRHHIPEIDKSTIFLFGNIILHSFSVFSLGIYVPFKFASSKICEYYVDSEIKDQNRMDQNAVGAGVFLSISQKFLYRRSIIR
jgi:hypothetical protein